MLQEIEALATLLIELEEQHRCIIVNDIFGMEACVGKIKEANKNIAFIEVERRKLTENRAMTEMINIVTTAMNIVLLEINLLSLIVFIIKPS